MSTGTWQHTVRLNERKAIQTGIEPFEDRPILDELRGKPFSFEDSVDKVGLGA